MSKTFDLVEFVESAARLYEHPVAMDILLRYPVVQRYVAAQLAGILSSMTPEPEWTDEEKAQLAEARAEAERRGLSEMDQYDFLSIMLSHVFTAALVFAPDALSTDRQAQRTLRLFPE